MSKVDIILIGGIVLACIWLMTYIIIEDDKKRKVILATGAIIDIILYFIGKNSGFLLVGVIGGILCALIPDLGGSRRKYENAVREAKGVKNLVPVLIIFFVMIFMFVSIAYPGMEISWE